MNCLIICNALFIGVLWIYVEHATEVILLIVLGKYTIVMGFLTKCESGTDRGFSGI